MAFRFEDLKVWQKAMELDEQINRLTKSFPKDEVYVLTSQIKGSRFCNIKYC
jgi:four helix bundle protein